MVRGLSLCRQRSALPSNFVHRSVALRERDPSRPYRPCSQHMGDCRSDDRRTFRQELDQCSVHTIRAGLTAFSAQLPSGFDHNRSRMFSRSKASTHAQRRELRATRSVVIRACDGACLVHRRTRERPDATPALWAFSSGRSPTVVCASARQCDRTSLPFPPENFSTNGKRRAGENPDSNPLALHFTRVFAPTPLSQNWCK